MIELIKNDLKIDFAKYFKHFGIVSLIIVLLAWVLVFVKGLNYGVDFRGGAEVQIKFQQTVKLSDLREVLERDGYANASVQSIGDAKENEYLVKVMADEMGLNAVTQKISASLQSNFSSSGAEIRKTDIVGPKAGAELRAAGFKAMLYSIIAILIYVGLRFDFKYAPGAVIALIHDASIILLVWVIFGFEFNLQTVAAILSIIGYSVNDTVVIYDRVREHEEKSTGLSMNTILNNAINETLSRTVLTAGATFLSAITMYVLGGESIKDFFLAISIGIIAGTYSTIYIASQVTMQLDKYPIFNANQKRLLASSSSSSSSSVSP